jgi:DNA-binding transcriptional ArsR family regulator
LAIGILALLGFYGQLLRPDRALAERDIPGLHLPMLKGLANESRLMIMCVLAEGEISVGQLNQRIKLSQSALSQHLAVLRDQGLVQTRRESQTIYYRLEDSAAMNIIELLHDFYCKT